MRRTVQFTLGLAAIVALGAACKDKPVPADNTKTNERDRPAASAPKTPLDQGQRSADVDISAKIRRELMSKDISSNAKNVKIITNEGDVTLRGPVASEDERSLVVSTAQAVAGVDHVDNQLEVAP